MSYKATIFIDGYTINGELHDDVEFKILFNYNYEEESRDCPESEDFAVLECIGPDGIDVSATIDNDLDRKQFAIFYDQCMMAVRDDRDRYYDAKMEAGERQRELDRDAEWDRGLR